MDKSVFENAPGSDWLHEGLTPDEIEESRIKAKVMMLLQDFRREHGYTQRQLGKLLGVTQGLVSRWENGDENIKIRTLAKIAVVTGAVIEINGGVPQEAKERVRANLKNREIDFSDVPELT